MNEEAVVVWWNKVKDNKYWSGAIQNVSWNDLWLQVQIELCSIFNVANAVSRCTLNNQSVLERFPAQEDLRRQAEQEWLGGSNPTAARRLERLADALDELREPFADLAGLQRELNAAREAILWALGAGKENGPEFPISEPGRRYGWRSVWQKGFQAVRDAWERQKP